MSKKGRDLSTEGETRLVRGRLVYGGVGSYTEGETRLQRARLFYGGTDSYTEGEAHIWRGRLVYGGRLVYKGGGSYRDYTRCYWECPEWPEHSMCRIYTYMQGGSDKSGILKIFLENLTEQMKIFRFY